MKASLFSAVAIAVGTAIFSSPAIADENDGKGWYGTAGIGTFSLSDPEGEECEDLFGGELCADYEYEFDTALSGEIGVGYDFGKFRVEATYVRSATSLSDVDIDVTFDGVEIGGLDSDVDGGDSELNSFMLNGYFDFHNDSKFVPYVGGGIGYTVVGFSGYSITVLGEEIEFDDGSEATFSYQAKVGVSYLASEKIDIFGEAVFAGTSGFTLEGVDVDPVTGWGAKAGLRYRF